MAEQNVDILNKVSAETNKTLGLFSDGIVENFLRDIERVRLVSSVSRPEFLSKLMKVTAVMISNGLECNL